MQEDYYQLLGVHRSVTQEEIENAYRKLTIETNANSECEDEKAAKNFLAIQEAYQVLSDPGQRKKYNTTSLSFTTTRSIGRRAPPGTSESSQSQASPFRENLPRLSVPSRERSFQPNSEPLVWLAALPLFMVVMSLIIPHSMIYYVILLGMFLVTGVLVFGLPMLVSTSSRDGVFIAFLATIMIALLSTITGLSLKSRYPYNLKGNTRFQDMFFVDNIRQSDENNHKLFVWRKFEWGRLTAEVIIGIWPIMWLWVIAMGFGLAFSLSEHPP